MFNIPTQIAGIPIPQEIPDLDELKDLAGKAAELAAAGFDGLAALTGQAEVVKDVVGKGATTVKGSCNALGGAASAVTTIQKVLEPVMPLMCARDNPVAAWQMLTKENLDTCVKVIKDVLGLSDLLKAIAEVLGKVKEAFVAIKDAAQPIVDKVMEFLADVAQEFASALHLDDALSGMVEFFERMVSLVTELGDIGNVLGPICDAWGDNDWGSVGGLITEKWEEMMDAFSRFMPAWESGQELYNQAKGFAGNALSKAVSLCASFAKLVEQLFKQLSMDTPEWATGLVAILAGVLAPPGVDIQRKPKANPAVAAVTNALAPVMVSATEGLQGGRCQAMLRSLFARCSRPNLDSE